MASNALTKEIILEKCKKDNFKEIKNVNLWGSDLEDMTLIRQLTNIEVVSLSVNKINTLQHFSYCPKIQELYLRKNLISDLKEIRYLQNLKNLRVLWLSDNPCASEQNYRAFIIKMIPQLTKIDSHEITDDERKQASKINFDQYMGSMTKVPSNRNILQQNLMSQNNANVKQSKSPFKSNENLGGGASQSKLESLRSNNEHSQNSGYQNPVKRIQNMQQNRQQNSQSAHAPRNQGSNFPGNQAHNQSVTNTRSHQQINNENQQNTSQHTHNNSVSQNVNTHRNENILCAVLALIKELNESELELIKRDIEKKLSLQQQKTK